MADSVQSKKQSALTESTGDPGGGGQLSPILAEVRDKARKALPSLLDRLIQIARTPERGDQASIMAVREVVALAQITEEGTTVGDSGARVYVLVNGQSPPPGARTIDAQALTDAARRELREGGG